MAACYLEDGIAVRIDSRLMEAGQRKGIGEATFASGVDGASETGTTRGPIGVRVAGAKTTQGVHFCTTLGVKGGHKDVDVQRVGGRVLDERAILEICYDSAQQRTLCASAPTKVTMYCLSTAHAFCGEKVATASKASNPLFVLGSTMLPFSSVTVTEPGTTSVLADSVSASITSLKVI